MHPATAAILEHFKYEHLPLKLQVISRPVCELAHVMAETQNLEGAELTAGLRKLLDRREVDGSDSRYWQVRAKGGTQLVFGV